MERTQIEPGREAPPSTGNRILDEPATPAVCAEDYAAGAADRHSSEKRDAKARR